MTPLQGGKEPGPLADRGAGEVVEVRKDGAIAWLVCLASFWVHGSVFGIINCFGVLYPTIHDLAPDKDQASFHASLVGSLCVGTTFALSPVASLLADKFGARLTVVCGGLIGTLGLLLSAWAFRVPYLWATYGGLLGVGSTMAYAPSLAVLAHYFNRRLGLANGVATAGSSVFTALLPLPLSAMLSSIGLANTFRVMSVLMLTVAICGATFRSPVVVQAWEEEDKEPVGCCDVLNRSIWKNRRFVVWVVSIPLALFGYFVPYVHLVQHVSDVFPDANGETLVTCMGITSGLGRILFGRLADLPNVSPVILQQTSFMVMGLLTLCIAAAHTYVSLVLVCLLLGLCDGCFISLIGPAAQRLTGTDGASQAIGFLLGFCSVPLTAGPPAAGILYDRRGNYNLAFLLAGVPPIVAAMLMCSIHVMKPGPEEAHRTRLSQNDILGACRLSGPAVSKPEEGEEPPHDGNATNAA
ncbi:monocarboxylate transporter 10-like [Haemaphysalis longicornis]